MNTKKNKPSHTQGFIPLKTIRNGIIETTDNRYIKILEIEPINFQLRSDEEQHGIIASFAAWLKISPVKLQFKSIVRKADLHNHLSKVQEEVTEEENTRCQEMGDEYIRFVQALGKREALNRRFFLIFQYEPLTGQRLSDATYDEIYHAIHTAAQNAKSYFMQCGNAIVQPEDEDFFAAEMLYTFFNRRSCVANPLSTRIDRIVLDTMAMHGKTLGVDDVPNVDATNFIAPRGIDFSHRDYIVMDGLYYTFLYIRRDGYPNRVRSGWMSALINAGEGVDIDIFLNREYRGKTIDKVARQIRLNRTKLKGVQDTSTDYEELQSSIQAGYHIKQGISQYNEDLIYLSVLITVSAASYDEMIWRKRQITDMLKSMDVYVGDCAFQQEAALRSVMPFNSVDANLTKKSRRNVLTSGAASCYPFTSFELSDDNGVLLGQNWHNHSLCILDLFNSKVNKNANVAVFGTSGAGKSVTLQALALRMRMRGIQSFIIAPLKGHEFRRACNHIGGSFIKISPGSKSCINVMEIRRTTSPEMALIDEVDYFEEDSLLARKIQQLLIFFALLVPDMSNEEEQMLDEALIKTYAACGIYHDNDSLYVDATHTDMKTMPILGDLHKQLLSNPMTTRIAAILSRFVTGSAQSFNQQTNVDLENKYVVIDISELKGKLLPVGMLIALDYVWDTVKSDRTKRKMVFIDEIWQLLGAGSNRQAGEFCLEIFKIIRGYGGGALAATQDLSDFFGLEDGKFGRAIINNSRTKIILNLEPDEAEHVRETLKLTRAEIRAITHFERGEALVTSNSNKIPVYVCISDTEKRLLTTDRAELSALLKEKSTDTATPQ